MFPETVEKKNSPRKPLARKTEAVQGGCENYLHNLRYLSDLLKRSFF